MTRPRLLITTDIGGDPDDEQSLVRLLAYANEFELEGLLPTASGTPGERENAAPRPDLIRALIAAYADVLPRLQRHADGWPDPDALLGLVHPGRAERGRDFVGPRHDTAASRWIVDRVDAGTPARPLNIAIWGGQTDFAQALWHVRDERGAAGLARFVARLRVYDIADQDGLSAWIRAEFPGIHGVLSLAPSGHDKREATFRGMYLGGDESLTSREWIEQNVRSTGALGALYPTKTWTEPNPHGCLKEGDTPSWFFFLPAGGNDPADPGRPGWGGRYVRDGESTWWIDVPVVTGDEARATVHAHRPAFQADFARRMAWCRE